MQYLLERQEITHFFVNPLVFITATETVFCEVGTGFYISDFFDSLVNLRFVVDKLAKAWVCFSSTNVLPCQHQCRILTFVLMLSEAWEP